MADSSTETPEPSVSTAPTADTAASAPAPAVTSESAPAQGEKVPTSPLDAVTKALNRSSKPGVEAGSPTAETGSPKTGEADPKTPPEGAEPDDLSEEEKARLHPKTQARIRWLTSQKEELTGKLETANRERDTFRPKAENYDKLTGYLTRSGISSDEANNSLEVTRLIKAGDFPAALKVLTPIYQEVQRRAGELLDPDLQEEVRLGHTPHERALETQRLRAAQAARNEQDARRDAQQREQSTAQANREFVDSVAKAADDWAKAKAVNDPDWSRKQAEVAEIVELDLRRNGFPKSKQDAIDRSEKALAQVNARWKGLRGTPNAVTPTTGNGGRVSTRAIEPPKSPMEAIERALAGG